MENVLQNDFNKRGEFVSKHMMSKLGHLKGIKIKVNNGNLY
jgi:5S rRNA maturation endonuclease (ribonuclease M5)